MMSKMTEQEYLDCLAMLIEEMPNHVLIPELRKGYSVMNCVYLTNVIKKIDIKIPERKIKEAGNDDLSKMEIRKSTLFGQRAKWTNKFHKCTTDQQRAAISDEIQLIQEDIAQVMKEIKYFEKHHTKMPVIVHDKYPVPVKPIDQYKKLASLRSMRSQVKRRLKIIADLPKAHPDWQKVEKEEMLLKHYNNYIIYVERSIKS